jgi:hypothetical protein
MLGSGKGRVELDGSPSRIPESYKRMMSFSQDNLFKWYDTVTFMYVLKPAGPGHGNTLT